MRVFIISLFSLLIFATISIATVAAGGWEIRDAGNNKLFPLTFNAVYIDNRWFLCGYGELYSSQDNFVSYRKITLFQAAAPAAMFSGAVSGVAFGNGRYVGVTPAKILVSNDGLRWDDKGSYMHTGANSSVAFGNGLFVVAGGDGKHDNAIQTSMDGRVWRQINLAGITSGSQGRGFPRLRAVIYANNQFCAIGQNPGNKPAIYTSPDGINWDEKIIGEKGESYNSVIYGDKLYIAVGDKGRVALSTDLVKWEKAWSGTNSDLLSIAYGNNRYIAAGKGGVLISSINGKKWDKLQAVSNRDIYGIGYGDGIFAAAGVDGLILGK